MDTTRNNSGVNWFSLLTPARDDGSSGETALRALIERIRRRWRLRLLTNGLAWTLVLASALILLAAWLVNHWHFSPNAVWTLRLVSALSLLALVFHYCIKPLRRRVDDLQVALYLEEHEPGLKSIMLSAVDARRGADDRLSAQLVLQLQQRALEACARVGYGDRVEQQNILRAGSRLGLALVVVAGLAIWPPAFLHSGAPALLQPWVSASEVSPYHIELAPGDIEIARASDQLISATIAGFDGDDVLLFTSTDDGAHWRQTAMTSARGPGRFESLLFDVDADTDYYVSGAGRQTPTYRITVATIPAIEAIGLRYHFPAYTMLPPQTTEGSGDIAALRGTRVEVLIEPTIEIPGGALQLADGGRIELRRGADGWIGEFTLREDGAYRVTLQRDSGAAVDASPEYRISALDDRFPSVSILSPGRDTRVSMIEEALLKVRASDDQGIDRLELVLSVNGEQEQRIGLIPAAHEPGPRQRVEAEHIVYLEDLGLRPGDLISYYVSATDRAPADAARIATSDMFFYQVRPFSQNYHRAEQQGGGGAGGAGAGGQQQGHLAEQQKQFVVATFKMIRDRGHYSDAAYRENLELLTTAQARIRDRVEAILRRIKSRGIVQLDERYQAILDELPAAAAAMLEVEARLPLAEVEAALSHAQVALKHLQRADAEFRDINVSLANRGGAAGGNAASQDLANLFQLEMDKLRHQYDTVQHGAQQPQPSQVIDETLEKLRELARRQQQEVERQLRNQGQGPNDGANRRQLELAEQLEAMARQLERLSREQPDQQLRQSAAQMRNAAEAMRRAASSAGASGGGGVVDARQAAANLRAARDLLEQGRQRQFSENLERSLRRAELAQKRQAAIKRDVSQLDSKMGDRLKEQLQRLQQKKQALSAELTDLEAELNRLSAAARDEQPEAGESLKQAVQAAREHRLHDRIGRTGQMVLRAERQHALDNESEIQKGIGEIREHIESALQNVGEADGRGLEKSLEAMRELARELRYLRERAAATAAGQGAGAGNSAGTRLDGGAIEPGELQDIAARARRLGAELLDQDVAAGDIDALLARIESLADGSAASAAQHDLALRALMELEYSLRERLQQPGLPQPMISEPSAPPDDYREMVADYFRRLSQQ
jgi:hypothetical protein